MSCTYTYKGHFIGTVALLNDFLLERLKFESKYGDLVFQLSSRTLATESKLDTITDATRDLVAKYNEAAREARHYPDGEAMLKLKRPYVGVSEFLSGQHNEEGHLYFPEFIEGEYWSRRFIRWGVKDFTDDEIELFFDGDKDKAVEIPVGNLDEWRKPNGEFKESFGSTEQKRLRQMMEDKWQNQAKLGTEIHDVLQILFSKTKKGKLWADILSDTAIGPMQTKRFIDFVKSSGKVKNLSDDRIKEIIDYGQELKQEIRKKYGEKCTFHPEFTVFATLNKEFEGKKGFKVLGRIDLLVVDEDGFPQIIDYKTSPKEYAQFALPKKLGFTYQLAMYQRMLGQWGLTMRNSEVMVAPIQMEGFRREGGKWTFDKVTKGVSNTFRPSGEEMITPNLQTLNTDEKYLNDNLDECIEAPLTITGNTANIQQRVSKWMEKIFPSFGDGRVKTDTEIRNLIIEQKGEKWLDPATNQYTFTPKGSNHTITVNGDTPNAEAKFFDKVKQWYRSGKENNVKSTARYVRELKKGQKEGAQDLDIDDSWLRARLSKYCSPEWEVMSEDIQEVANQFGMIILHNKETDVIDVVKITYRDPAYVNDWGGRDHQNLTGAHQSDSIENARSDSMMLKAANGNIELMEAMAVLNNINFSGEAKIGKISIISPNQKHSLGLTASNRELAYCWRRLNEIEAMEGENLFDKGSIRMLSEAEQMYNEFKDIIYRVGVAGNRHQMSEYSKFTPALTKLHDVIEPGRVNVEVALQQLEELRKILEKDFGMRADLDKEGKSIHNTMTDYDNELQYKKTLYQAVTKAMLDLNNIIIHQELHPHDNWVESVKVLTEGFSGNYWENANNFGNRLLNQVSSIALEGVQNAREIGFPKIRTLRDKVEDLKRDAGYSGLLEHTVGNQTSLYEGMTYFHDNGNLLFRNPWDDSDPVIAAMSPKRREFLKYVLLEINKNKNPNDTEEDIKERRRSSVSEFFEVPLIEASFASKVNTDGWLGWLKNRFKMFTSKENFKKGLKDMQSEYLSDDIEQHTKKTNINIFEAVNMMDQGTGPNRIEMINDLVARHGKGYFERDLERILGTHTWAYATHDAFDTRMPLIKAAYISLAIAGNEQNIDYEGPQKFIKEYVQNRINHQSIVDPKFQTVKGGINMLQRAASWMALAFSPVQFTYQSLEGIWKDAKLIITKPDGTETFTLQNMKDSAKLVYKELFHVGDHATTSQAVNAFYGINDMDAASFVENNSSNNHGIFNFFGKFAFKMSSRPDFYNRMTIFVAQMMKDGSWEAHSVDPKTNQLVYDWKKDKRFRAYAMDDKSNMEEYNKARALYYATAQQLVREGARNKKGELFKIGDELPKAYSNKESEAKKAVGDTMYGYYDSTKKSLVQSTLMGGLVMQMRTFWSGKKNQYFAPGGIKGQGKWVVAKDPNGNELYYSKNEDGTIDHNGPLVTKDDPRCSGTQFLQWKGKFEEGVMLTLFDIVKTAKFNLNPFDIFGLRSSWKEKINAEGLDEDVRKTYITNMKLFWCDLFLVFFIGALAALAKDWADDLMDENKKDPSLSLAMGATFGNIVARSVKNSGLDAAWWSAISEPAIDWNPFALTYIANEAKLVSNLVVGDKSFADTVVSSMSAARQMRPMFELVKA